jgi:hypothetical protein
MIRNNHRGLGRHQRRGVVLVPGFLAGIRGRYWANAYGWEPMGGCLLVDARRSSLAVQFGEKCFFLQIIAGPQQFQERILRVASLAAALA